MNNIIWWHRIQLTDGTYTPGMVHHGPDGGDWPTTRFGLPNDLTNKTVIDVGCWDGFFSFESEKRNAKTVLAVDAPSNQGGNPCGTDGFEYARKNLNSKVEFKPHNIESIELTKTLGIFDIVLFYGVLYHLKNPLVALENACDLSKELLIIETAISTNSDLPILEYRPIFHGDPTNYFYPTIEWIKLVCKHKGFNNIEVIYNNTQRATIKCRR